MTRLKSLIAPFAILIGFGLLATLISCHHSVVPAEPNADHRADAAYRDYKWYAALAKVDEIDTATRIESVAYSNSSNPQSAREDHKRGQRVADSLADAERRLPIAEKISRETGDPLPLWAATAMLNRARADWLLRQEVLKALGRPHQSLDPIQRRALEQECAQYTIMVRTYWDQHCAGVGLESTFPVTLP